MQNSDLSKKDFSDALDAVAALQKDGCKFPCPRCGRTMREPMLYNCLSRHAQVYVCEMCGADEAILNMKGAVKPLEDWYFVGLLDELDGDEADG